MPHRNSNQPNRTACAPYNFIPLSEHVVSAVDVAEALPDHHRFTNQGYDLSGYIDVELKTETPLFVRGPLTRAERRRELAGQYISGQAQAVDDRKPQYKRVAKNKPDFFYIDPKTKEPVIPGSSLRGMLRSLLEIASYGKFTRFDDRQLIFRAVGDSTSIGAMYRDLTVGPNTADNPNRAMRFEYPRPQLQAGYLRKTDDGWAIQPALRFHGESFVHVNYDLIERQIGGRGRWRVHDVYVLPAARSAQDRGNRSGRKLILNLAVSARCTLTTAGPPPDPGMQRAKLVESGHSPRKHMHCAVYQPDPTAEPIPILGEMWNLYKADCDLSRGDRTRTRILGEDGDVLFYLVSDKDPTKVTYFGSTMFFRIPYSRSLKECVPQNVVNRELIDLADAMFGFVREEAGRGQRAQGSKGQAYASRVYFSDATRNPDQKLRSNLSLTPKILASPKPTCFQHYVEQDDPNVRKELNHYATPFKYEDYNERTGKAEQVTRGAEPRLRGFKRYWHQQGVSFESLRGQEPRNGISTQLTYMSPQRAKTSFCFRVHFRNLSKVELGALLWILDPGASCTPRRTDLRHKLGMGKPYGMGSVSLTISNCICIDRRERYAQWLTDAGWETGEKPISQDEQQQYRTAFEGYILAKLGSSEAGLADLLRIKMLLRMMQWPGETVTAVQSGQPADATQRVKNVRYMTIDNNEYKDRLVLPDPTAWMDANDVAASIAEPARPEGAPTSQIVDSPSEPAKAKPAPEITIAIGDANQPFPRFAVDDWIEVTAGEQWSKKKKRMAPVYHAADGAQAAFQGNLPTADAEGRLLGRVLRIDAETKRYYVTVKLP